MSGPGTPRRLRGDQGAATTELVLATPAMLFVLVTLVQFGLWFHAVHVARAAADEAARVARVENGTREAGEARGNAFLAQNAGRLIPDGRVTVSMIGNTVHAETRGHVVKLWLVWNLSVDAVVESPKERFVPDG